MRRCDPDREVYGRKIQLQLNRLPRTWTGEGLENGSPAMGTLTIHTPVGTFICMQKSTGHERALGPDSGGQHPMKRAGSRKRSPTPHWDLCNTRWIPISRQAFLPHNLAHRTATSRFTCSTMSESLPERAGDSPSEKSISAACMPIRNPSTF